MYLISIDPGPSTGIAEFEGSDVVATTTTQEPHDLLRQRLRVLNREHPGLTVVCEQGPKIRHYADACAEVEAIVRQEADAIYWVRPSQWKPHPSAKLEEDDPIQTRHERDAVKLGRYFIAQGGFTQYERITEAADTPAA